MTTTGRMALTEAFVHLLDHCDFYERETGSAAAVVDQGIRVAQAALELHAVKSRRPTILDADLSSADFARRVNAWRVERDSARRRLHDAVTEFTKDQEGAA